LKRNFVFFIVFSFLVLGCFKTKTVSLPDSLPVEKLREILAEGHYDEALKLSKEISNQVPPGNGTEEALYIEAYARAFGKTDFQGARLPLKQLLDIYPNGVYSAEAQKLLADCQYWQGHYHNASRDYKKLAANYEKKGLAGYAQMQAANCLLLDDKVADALAAYRELVEKYPMDSVADSAQLMIANSYIKLQNPRQAKSELQKLMSFTRNGDIQRAAQKALRQIEEEEPFRKGVGVYE
jgi:TolA-binding protein